MGESIITQPMQWASISSIGGVAPLSVVDHDCLSEIRDVLAKHGRLGRFGITLIHKAFEIGEDECLVEFVDVRNRTLTARPFKKAFLGPNAVETQWQLAYTTALMTCLSLCYWADQGHDYRHYLEPA